MTRTVLESATKTVIIGFDEPFCVIGERINPTGRKKLAAELEQDDFSTIDADALALRSEQLDKPVSCTSSALQFTPNL